MCVAVLAGLMLGCGGGAAVEVPTVPDVVPVPPAEVTDPVEVEPFDCWSETVIDDREVVGDANRLRYEGYDASVPELRLVYRATDDEADGRWDMVERWAYDDLGQKVGFVREGDRPTTETWSYDALGNVAAKTRDDDSDGTVDYARSSIWDGEREVERTEDFDGDGVVDVRRELTVSDDGLTHTLEVFVDDGRHERHVTTFDEQGRSIEFTMDLDVGDAIIDREILRTYDAKGPGWVESFDDPIGGEIEWFETFLFDDQERYVGSEVARSSGVVYRTQTYELDGEGRTLRSRWQNTEIEKVSESVYVYDERGRLVEWRRRVVREGDVEQDDVGVTTFFGTCR